MWNVDEEKKKDTENAESLSEPKVCTRFGARKMRDLGALSSVITNRALESFLSAASFCFLTVKWGQ